MTDNHDVSPPSSRPQSRKPSTRRALLRIYIIFAVTLLLLFTITMIRPVYFRAVVPFNEFLAKSTAVVLGVFGEDGLTVQGVGVTGNNNGFSIAEGCNGIYALAIVLAGIIATPAPWKPKLIGLVLAMIFVMVLNYIRLLSLWYAGKWLAFMFDAIHLYIWEFVIIALGAGFWYFWYEKFVKTD